YTIEFLNNTVYAGGNGAQYGILFPEEGFNNVIIRNNILQGFEINPIEIDGSLINGFSIENNIFCQNGTNSPNVLGSPVNYVCQNNQDIILDYTIPWVDFTVKTATHIQNEGLDVGLNTDFAGNPIVGLSDIGAYEIQ
ncbi:MAG: hypothetical protein PF447_00165, partial [Spirochaetaceae bacterium]|nr:hypothetical protein [Spirochaetaceae bacterium]